MALCSEAALQRASTAWLCLAHLGLSTERFPVLEQNVRWDQRDTENSGLRFCPQLSGESLRATVDYRSAGPSWVGHSPACPLACLPAFLILRMDTLLSREAGDSPGFWYWSSGCKLPKRAERSAWSSASQKP